MLKPSDIEPRLPKQSPESVATLEWARDMLVHVNAQHERSLQTSVGPSEIGDPCDRKLAYKITGTEPANVELKSLQAFAGTGIHRELAESIKRLFDDGDRYLVEQRVEYRGVSGTADLFDTETGRVVDWKTAGSSKLNRLRRRPVWSPSWKVQTNTYGAGLEAAGHAVRSVSIVLIPRDGNLDDVLALTMPYDKSIADEAIDRLEGLQDGRSPSATDSFPSYLCSYCPYYRPGWTGSLNEACAGSASPVHGQVAVDATV